MSTDPSHDRPVRTLGPAELAAAVPDLWALVFALCQDEDESAMSATVNVVMQHADMPAVGGLAIQLSAALIGYIAETEHREPGEVLAWWRQHFGPASPEA